MLEIKGHATNNNKARKYTIINNLCLVNLNNTPQNTIPQIENNKPTRPIY